MIVLEFKLAGVASQYAALDEAIRTTQFTRNKCVRKWRDERGVKPYDLNRYCAVLAKECAFSRANSTPRRGKWRRNGRQRQTNASTTTVVPRCRGRKAILSSRRMHGDNAPSRCSPSLTWSPRPEGVGAASAILITRRVRRIQRVTLPKINMCGPRAPRGAWTEMRAGRR